MYFDKMIIYSKITHLGVIPFLFFMLLCNEEDQLLEELQLLPLIVYVSTNTYIFYKYLMLAQKCNNLVCLRYKSFRF